jgi:hypothetical protein
MEGKLNHPLQKLVCRNPGEVVTNRFFAEQPANIAKFSALVLSGVHKVSMSVVDDSDILVHIKFMSTTTREAGGLNFRP